MVRTIYQQLSPAGVHGQLDRVGGTTPGALLQVAELLVGAVLAEQHDEWAEARLKGKSGGTEFAQRLLCPTAIIALLVNRFDAQFGSSNIHYVNQFFRGSPPPAWFRFSPPCSPGRRLRFSPDQVTAIRRPGNAVARWTCRIS